MSNSISSKIKTCNDCQNRLGGTPFYFELKPKPKEQPIMIITAVPSLQAMYKPLTSIRFFRHLCVTLFGDMYLNNPEKCEKYLLEFCDGSIYWTHYHKCYSYEYSADFSSIGGKCAKKFLNKEVEQLNPELIIIFGKEIWDKVAESIDVNKYFCIFKDFPKNGFDRGYDDVRQAIVSLGLDRMKYVKEIGFKNQPKDFEYHNEYKGHLVHLEFELKAFLKMYEGKENDITERSIDDLWYKNLVVPNMQRSVKLTSVYSFCENQIKVVLLDYFSRNNDFTILKGLKEKIAAAVPTKKEVIDYIKDYWGDALGNYVDHIKL